MNPNTSPLKEQFPLSPKKFWKKFLPKLIGTLIGAVIIIVFFGFIGGIFLSASGLVSQQNLIPVIIFSISAITILYFILRLGFSIWYIKTYIRNYYYAGEENFITIRKGVFTMTEIHVQWQKIQDVYVDQDLFDRAMGLFDVHIASATATSGMEAHIDGVEKEAAEGLKRFILEKVAQSGISRQQNLNSQQGIVQSADNQIHNQHSGQYSNQSISQRDSSQSGPVSFSEKISSNEYPLTQKWFRLSIFSRVFNSVLLPAIVGLPIMTKIFFADNPAPDLTIPLAIFVLAIIGIFIISFINLILWKKNYAFEFTPEHIYYRTGVITISEKHMPYSSLQDVTIVQGPLERYFDLARVNIENAAQMSIQTKNGAVPVFSGIVLHGLSLAQANKITEILKSTVLNKNNSRFGL